MRFQPPEPESRKKPSTYYTAVYDGNSVQDYYMEDGTWANPAPIGFYFAKLWYWEKLYPLVWTVAALGQAARALGTSGSVPQPAATSPGDAGTALRA